MKVACIAMALAVLGFATPVVGQEIIVPAPVVTYYSPAPVAAYYAPAPVVTYYAPYTAAYGPAYAPAYRYYPAPYYVPRSAYRRAARWGW